MVQDVVILTVLYICSVLEPFSIPLACTNLCVIHLCPSLSLWTQDNLLPVPSRGGDGQHPGAPAGVLWGGAMLLGH